MGSTPHHVLTVLAVTDLATCADFYRQVLGCAPAVQTPVYVEFTPPGGARIGLYERVAFGRNTAQTPQPIAPGQLSPVELYFHVEARDGALEDACQRLQRAGARLLSPPQPRAWGDRAAYFADPEGHVLVMAQPVATGPGD